MVVNLDANKIRQSAFVTCSICLATCMALFVVAPIARAQTFETLYSFKGQASGDGQGPAAGVILDGVGNMYGTTLEGGSLGNGTVFRVSANGDERILYAWGKQPLAGGSPEAPVTRDAAGNLYGTSLAGGNGLGAVFKLGVNGTVVLHSFSGAPDGEKPNSGVVRDCCGNVYGTTGGGGLLGAGTVFRINKDGSETVLHSFWGGDGVSPNGSLIGAGAGIFFGTTSGGIWKGHTLFGTVYKIDSTGKETVLYTFTGGADGANPVGALFLDVAGNLYGATSSGGDATCRCGVIFKLDASGHETVLHTFIGGTDGAKPGAGLAQDASGNLYGTTEHGGDPACQCGVIFKLDSEGNESVLYSFTGGADGSGPNGLFLGPDGSLYGTAFGAGESNFGTVFRLAI